jgi:hypothetical protein
MTGKSRLWNWGVDYTVGELVRQSFCGSICTSSEVDCFFTEHGNGAVFIHPSSGDGSNSVGKVYPQQ